MTKMDAFIHRKCVRIPQSIYDLLVAAAKTTAIAPAGMLRSIVVTRLQDDNFEPLVRIVASTRSRIIGMSVDCPRITVRMDAEMLKTANKAAKAISRGSFNKLVHAILTEHFGLLGLPPVRE